MKQSNGMKKFRSELECRFPELCDMSVILSKWIWKHFNDRVLFHDDIVTILNTYINSAQGKSFASNARIAKAINEAQKKRMEG